MLLKQLDMVWMGEVHYAFVINLLSVDWDCYII